MIIYYGTRMYGRVDQVGAASVRTRFFHVSFLPLIPLGSYAVLDDGTGGGNTFRGVPIGLHGRSVLAGYLRVWGFAAAILGAIAAYPSIPQEHDPLAALGLTVALVVPFLVALAAMFWIGRLGFQERAQRWVYATYAGSPIDVALLADGRFGVREQLHTLLVERGRACATGLYRTAMDPETQWLEIALDPGTQDVTFVRAAFVRARIEWSLATGDERARYATAHATLWRRVMALDPAPHEKAGRAIPSMRGPLAMAALGALAVGGLISAAWSERAAIQAHDAATLAEMRSDPATPRQPPMLTLRTGGIAVTDDVPLRAGDAIAYLAEEGYRAGTVSGVGDAAVVHVRDDSTGANVDAVRGMLLYYPEP